MTTTSMRLSMTEARDVAGHLIECVLREFSRLGEASDNDALELLTAAGGHLLEAEFVLSGQRYDAEDWRRRDWRGLRPSTRRHFAEKVN